MADKGNGRQGVWAGKWSERKGTNRKEVRMADKGTGVKGNGKKRVTGKRSDKQLGRQARDERQRESERRGPGDKMCDRKGD
jgi:hypothetical protein